MTERETSLVSLSIEDSAVSRLLENTEKRAEMRCPTYNKNNRLWKRVDELMAKHERTVNRISVFDTKESVKPDPKVIAFLNNLSPDKKSNLKRSSEDAFNEFICIDSDFEEVVSAISSDSKCKVSNSTK